MEKKITGIILSLIVALSVCFFVAACSSESDNESDSTSQTSDSTAEDDAESYVEPDGESFSTAYEVTLSTDPEEESVKEGETIYYQLKDLTDGYTYEVKFDNISPSDASLSLVLMNSSGTEYTSLCSNNVCSWSMIGDGSVYLKVNCTDEGSSLNGDWNIKDSNDYVGISIKEGKFRMCDPSYLGNVSGTIDMRLMTVNEYSYTRSVMLSGDTLTITYSSGSVETYERGTWAGDSEGCEESLNSSSQSMASNSFPVQAKPEANTYRQHEPGYFDENGAWQGYYVKYDLESLLKETATTDDDDDDEPDTPSGEGCLDKYNSEITTAVRCDDPDAKIAYCVPGYKIELVNAYKPYDSSSSCESLSTYAIDYYCAGKGYNNMNVYFNIYADSTAFLDGATQNYSETGVASSPMEFCMGRCNYLKSSNTLPSGYTCAEE